jgi:toxin ParE1/3/4
VSRKPVITRRRADDDIDRAFESYLKDGGAELAVAFADDLERAVTHLSKFPLSGSPTLAQVLEIPGLRKWPLRQFPYLIIYIDSEHAVEIWRVLHSHSDVPAWLRAEE